MELVQIVLSTGFTLCSYQQNIGMQQENAVQIIQTDCKAKKTTRLSDDSTDFFTARFCLSYVQHGLFQLIKRLHLAGKAFFLILPGKSIRYSRYVARMAEGTLSAQALKLLWK